MPGILAEVRGCLVLAAKDSLGSVFSDWPVTLWFWTSIWNLFGQFSHLIFKLDSFVWFLFHWLCGLTGKLFIGVVSFGFWLNFSTCFMSSLTFCSSFTVSFSDEVGLASGTESKTGMLKTEWACAAAFVAPKCFKR